MAVIDNLTGTGSGALALGRNGSTNPVIKVDCSVSGAETGLEIKGRAAAAGADLTVISSGTNENLVINAKGSGTVTVNPTATGAIVLARNTSVTGTATVTSTSATALTIGANGATNPVLQVDANTASVATGIKLTGAAAAAGAAIAVISSGTNENLTVNAKGSGTVTINGTATGAITLARATGVTGALTGTSTSASALAVGANGATNPVIKINAATASVATGVEVTGAAAAGGVAVAAISSGTNENLTIDAKGSGTLTLQGTATGGITATRAVTAASSVLSTSGTAGIGYGSGAGGAVTQATSRTTGVTLNKVAGAITLVSAAGSTTPASFTVTNSAVAATDVVVLSQKSGTDKLDLSVTAVGAGSFEITFNTKSGTTTEQPVINFAVIKAVAA
jgi:hypothetical protein